MKDLSFFLFKNSLGVKMRKGIRNFCHGDGSTSTLNQHHHNPNPSYDDHVDITTVRDSPYNRQPTLEEMIMQLELEEEIARKSKMDDLRNRRRSCVNNSDILRSARNALNQYPRFSLDGKDAMYRSSFRNFDHVIPGRRSVCCDRGVLMRGRIMSTRNERRNSCLPTSLGGESVVWCKPGVIAKLMGLDAIPVPLNGKETLNSIRKRQNLRRRVERHEMERRDMQEVYNSNRAGKMMMRMGMASSVSSSSSMSTTNEGGGRGYCGMKPISVEPIINDIGGWPTGKFRHEFNQHHHS